MKFNNDNDYCFNIAKKKTKSRVILRFFCSQVIRLHLHLTEVCGRRDMLQCNADKFVGGTGHIVAFVIADSKGAVALE